MQGYSRQTREKTSPKIGLFPRSLAQRKDASFLSWIIAPVLGESPIRFKSLHDELHYPLATVKGFFRQADLRIFPSTSPQAFLLFCP
jgi:hypothetical protein